MSSFGYYKKDTSEYGEFLNSYNNRLNKKGEIMTRMDVDCVGIQDNMSNEKITRYMMGTPNDTANWGQGGLWAELRNHQVREFHELITVTTGTLEQFKELGETGYHIGHGEVSNIKNRQCTCRTMSTNQKYYH